MTPEILRTMSVMSGYGGAWGVAGGWAIDLFLDRQTRPHDDLDVAVLRHDQENLRRHLGAARVEKVGAHGLSEWTLSERLEPPIHEIHVQYPDSFHLEFLLNECNRKTNEWLFRRDVRVRRSMSAAFGSNHGIPYLSPEIVLLYKSKAPEAKDDADLAAILEHLSSDQREWLHHALTMTTPGHHWTDVISRCIRG